MAVEAMTDSDHTVAANTYNRSGTRRYNRLGGRPGLNVDFVAVRDAVQAAWSGSGETITEIALRFGVSRGWIHANVYPVLECRSQANSEKPPPGPADVGS